MFYYPTVLNRRTGCFATIWLVATKGVKVPRRDFLKVNVKSTCDDIMSYVLEQVPPPQPGLPRPRFSLYLSSQLQYGVVLVYHRQCAILLEEIHSILGRLLKPRVSQKIDLDDQVRQALDLPDALALLAEAEGALDPFFGVMSPWYLPGPNTLIEMGREYQREASAESPEPVSLAYVDVSAATSAITASPDTITLRETEPVAFLVPEFEGEDFVDQHPDTLDILLAQTDHFPDGDMEIPREEAVPAEPEREREREREMERTRREAELRGSTLELQPSVLPSEDTALLAQEETGLPAERPRPPGDQQTPVSGPVLPSPPPAAMGRGRAALKRTWRKKQLVFIDLETQLSDDVVKKQISDPQTETRRPPRPPPPPQTKSSAAELLNNPCALLPEEILFLWRRAATVTFLPGWDLQVRAGRVESSDSDREIEREMAAALEVADEAERERRRTELSPKEVPRDVSEAEMFDISGPGVMPLEASDDQREMSREMSPICPSEGDGSTVSRSVSTLQDIPEAIDELQERAEPTEPRLESPEHRETPVLFQSLLPPEADRRTVSNIFHRLLDVLSAEKLCAEQAEPYGHIHILPGRHYEQLLQDQ